MLVEPLVRAVRSLPHCAKSRNIFMTPDGATFSDATARRLTGYKRLVLICGRYEGWISAFGIFAWTKTSPSATTF